MIVNNTLKILNEYGLKAKKNYGQNFLTNPAILEKIINAAHITKEDYVIEIGPGIGSLTEYLCINAKKVLAYEIDKDMYDILEQTLKDYDNKEIILGDFLTQDVKQDISKYLDDSNYVKVVANLPYYITSPIMFKLLEIDNIVEMTFMVQKEMGDRFTGKVDTKDYNALSVYVEYFTNTVKTFNVARNNFFPAPNVDSVVLNSKVAKKEFNLKDEKEFLKFVRNIFSQRRKTMVNNIKNTYTIDKSIVEEKLQEINISTSIRSEALSLADIVRVYKKIFEE